jgi:DNA repair exonuclease SbcCD ATPase subunit
MLWKAIKWGTVGVGTTALLGGVVFGHELSSYLRSSTNSISRSIKDNIPMDFQISRARDLLSGTEEEMHKNLRLMAEEEVDIASLSGSIGKSKESLDQEKARLAKLRDDLTGSQTSFKFGEFVYTREQLAQELARRLKFFQEAQAALQQRQEILESRQKALATASQAMEVARAQRATLESEIDALEGRCRLVEATSNGGDVHIDNTKLAQAEQVVGEVRRQLDISEHVLAQEAKFTDPMEIDVLDEKDLLKKVDAQLSAQTKEPAGSDKLSDASSAIGR